MHLVVTRSYPPEIGGMQNLMEGLSNALLNHGPVQVFADSFEESEKYDQNSFDPKYESLPLEFFKPIVKKIFSRKPYSSLRNN